MKHHLVVEPESLPLELNACEERRQPVVIPLRHRFKRVVVALRTGCGRPGRAAPPTRPHLPACARSDKSWPPGRGSCSLGWSRSLARTGRTAGPAANCLTRKRWKLCTPRSVIDSRLPRMMSAHFSAQKLANSSRSSKASISLRALIRGGRIEKPRRLLRRGQAADRVEVARGGETRIVGAARGVKLEPAVLLEDVFVDLVAGRRRCGHIVRVGPDVSERRRHDPLQVTHQNDGLGRPSELDQAAGRHRGIGLVARAEDGQVSDVPDRAVVKTGTAPRAAAVGSWRGDIVAKARPECRSARGPTARDDTPARSSRGAAETPGRRPRTAALLDEARAAWPSEARGSRKERRRRCAARMPRESTSGSRARGRTRAGSDGSPLSPAVSRGRHPGCSPRAPAPRPPPSGNQPASSDRNPRRAREPAARARHTGPATWFRPARAVTPDLTRSPSRPPGRRFRTWPSPSGPTRVKTHARP